ncbi:OmpA family protein [Agarilytica rhodophyticola]|uniref:OmpA family protein n=1 Tax=Agarilytica rhodophyticola TaxID=1737490 RepID=UPI000B344ED4|nr:OmpA family protein [Agarilytica rhodophyticola]
MTVLTDLTNKRLKLVLNISGKMQQFILTCLLILLSNGIMAKDHPLLKAYPGSKEYTSRFTEYEPFIFPIGEMTGSDKPYTFKSLSKTGDLTRHTYVLNDVSSLKVFENYQQALTSAGFSLLYTCKLSACGDDQQAAYLGGLIAPDSSVYNYYHTPYYLVAEKQAANSSVIVTAFIGGYGQELNIQQVILEEKALQSDLLHVNTEYLKELPQVNKRISVSAEDRKIDHPLISRYPGSTVRIHKKTDYESIELPVKITTNAAGNSNIEKASLVGDIYKHDYEMQHVSTLKVYQNYRHAIEKANFDITFECQLDKCGNKEAIQKLGGSLAIEGSIYNSSNKPYFISAKKPAKKGDIYFSLYIGGYGNEVSINQTVVELEASEDDLIEVDADSLKRDLEVKGKALLYGIYFDTDKATIKPESKPTLDAVAELLNKDKALLLYVVGHTDDTGALAHNQQLSSRRAQAVVTALISDYKINQQRLVSAGVGPYAPESNNTSNAGKRLNRRVELVKRLK